MYDTCNDYPWDPSMMSARHMAPTTGITAWSMDYKWDICSLGIAGIAFNGVLPYDPCRNLYGEETICVDMISAFRANAIMCYHKAHYSWGPAILHRIVQTGQDSQRLINVVGGFALAVARNCRDYPYRLAPLTGFIASDHNLTYGMLVTRYQEYCAGNGLE